MQNFGKVFKKFRKSRNIKLKDMSSCGVSKSQLSRFEQGESELTISKFIKVLDAINMSMEEFMYAVHDFHRDELNELLNKVREFVTKKDVDGLEGLLIEQLERKDQTKTFNKLNSILIRIRLQELSQDQYFKKEDLKFLTDYLFSVEYWGHYELLLFSNTLDVLSHEAFMILAKEMSRRTDFYKEIPKNRRLIAGMLLNSYITCIERNELLDALYFEKQLNNCYFIETEIYERLVFKFARSYYEFKKYNNKEAILEMRKCIASMKTASSNKLACIFENYLKENIN